MKAVQLFLAGSLCLLAALTAATPVCSESVLRVSYNPMPLNLPSIILRREGYLEEALAPLGWRVAWISELQTGPLMSEAMAAGALDIAAVMGETSVVVARAAGNDLVVIAPYSAAPKAFGLVVPAAGGAAGIKDLAGKSVGLPIGTTAHYLLAKALKSVGMSLDGVEVMNMTVPDAAVAVAGGKLDAAVLVEPILSKLRAGGKVRLLRDGAGLIGGLTVTAARGEFRRRNPAVIETYLNAVARAGRFLRARPEEALAMTAEETKLPLDLLHRIAENYTFLEITRTAMLRELSATAAFLARAGLIARRPGLGELVAGA